MNYRIINFSGIKLAGFSSQMSFTTFNPAPLWQKLMPIKRIHGLTHNPGNFSVKTHFETLPPSPDAIFRLWAALEINGQEELPEDMELLEVPAGTYAVFEYLGLAAHFVPFYIRILSKELPALGYQPDLRPQFEYLPADYDPQSESSREEIWIPVRGID